MEPTRPVRLRSRCCCGTWELLALDRASDLAEELRTFAAGQEGEGGGHDGREGQEINGRHPAHAAG
ncbi:MAG: hypothetical protein ABFC96_11135 [Thermoguttaceae bacterium]